MLNFKKIKKKLIRSIIKIKQDKKTLHNIEVSKKYINENFKFNFRENILSDRGISRIFSFANYLEKESGKFKKTTICGMALHPTKIIKILLNTV